MMLIVSVSLLFIVGTAMTFPQASFYATNIKGTYPQILPRFGGDDSDIGNRLGENNPSTSAAAPSVPQSDVIHDPDIVSRVATWPKDRQPFWYINSQHIDSQRQQNIPCRNCVNPESLQQPLPQSPFARRN
ncbi:hypothetical protein L798_02557 [Zootermopsis nevadensis]|uniref:Uncharacterized protein n=1 Tax=Zootermopsis nevadensis TaxID=136037 RepID=A0A067QJI8_ZOONE|nr:hypothetical protein L798_02557 [Zootermopsis nevadensis]